MVALEDPAKDYADPAKDYAAVFSSIFNGMGFVYNFLLFSKLIYVFVEIKVLCCVSES